MVCFNCIYLLFFPCYYILLHAVGQTVTFEKAMQLEHRPMFILGGLYFLAANMDRGLVGCYL